MAATLAVNRRGPIRRQGRPRLIVWIALGAILSIFFATRMLPGDDPEEISYPRIFLDRVRAGEIIEGEYNNKNGAIKATDTNDEKYSSNGAPTPARRRHRAHQSERQRRLGRPDILVTTPPRPTCCCRCSRCCCRFALLILFFWWMQRRTSGQIGGLMSIGKSRAKTYSTESGPAQPSTM